MPSGMIFAVMRLAVAGRLLELRLGSLYRGIVIWGYIGIMEKNMETDIL